MHNSLLLIVFLGLLVFTNVFADSLENFDFEKLNEKPCKEGFEKIIKKTNQKSFCVKKASVEKLIQRGWAQNPNNSTNIMGNEKETNSVFLAQNIDSQCKYNMNCVISKLSALGENQDQLIFEDTVLNLLKIYETNNTSCHVQGHHIGMILYTYYGDVNKAVSKAGLECGGALFHGILETHFGADKFFNNSFNEFKANRICVEEFVDSKIKKWECLHGLGHGLLIAKDYDVFESLEFCNSFEGWELHACARGIFMENMIHVTNTSEGTIDENDIFYPCNKVDKQFAPDCYIYQSYYFQTLTKGFGSVANTFSFCDMIEPQEFIKNCYVGIGANMGELALSRAGNLAISNCMKGDLEYSSYCMVGIMRILADQKNPETALEFCNSIPEKSQTLCFEYFGKWADLISETPEEKTLECSNIHDGTYFDICQNASIDDDFI